jgi:hypothetical protein
MPPNIGNPSKEKNDGVFLNYQIDNSRIIKDGNAT